MKLGFEWCIECVGIYRIRVYSLHAVAGNFLMTFNWQDYLNNASHYCYGLTL